MTEVLCYHGELTYHEFNPLHIFTKSFHDASIWSDIEKLINWCLHDFIKYIIIKILNQHPKYLLSPDNYVFLLNNVAVSKRKMLKQKNAVKEQIFDEGYKIDKDKSN